MALAQPKSADDWYKEGETQYNLGNFDAAAEAFKQGFALEPNESKKAAYLYNVAQAYRQGNKCKDASFFYKRYLALKDRDTEKPLKPDKRAEIEARIAELDQCAATQESIANKPPGDTIRPDAGKTGTGTSAGTGSGTGTTVGTGGGEGSGDEGDEGEEGDEGDADAGSVTEQVFVKPRVINARVVGGAGKIAMGDLPTGIKPSFQLTGGYPIVTQGALSVDVGASLNFTPMPYENGMTHASETATLTTALVNAAATYTVAPKIALRGDLGVGALFFTGLKMGNPFTNNGGGTSGALGMLAVRVAASADYAITPNIVATVTPISFAFSPAKEGLRDDVSSILQIDFMLGVGYRM
ncbi:MAG TPA: hypothetical protein VFS15_01085 [Kofleriaceae bacterium]|nr:hypothetical protein [Kofleriaceae bacterium]